jgi:hypothetical protein
MCRFNSGVSKIIFLSFTVSINNESEYSSSIATLYSKNTVITGESSPVSNSFATWNTTPSS